MLQKCWQTKFGKCRHKKPNLTFTYLQKQQQAYIVTIQFCHCILKNFLSLYCMWGKKMTGQQQLRVKEIEE